jgi:ABC-2 type transport system ATP-binding protein
MGGGAAAGGAPDAGAPAPVPDPGPAIVLAGVCKSFAGTQVLHGISAAIVPGRVTGLVGPDGAGKTTLLRLIAGLMTPSAGTITVADCDTVAQRDRIASLIGYMPQRFGLYEDLSVRQNLRLYSQLRGLPAAQEAATFARLMAFTHLGPFAERLAGKLSGGMKQKLGLACALMTTPPVLLLDEPGVGVDPLSRRDLWAMVHAITSQGMAVVWSTAYLDEAERCAEVLLLDGGRLVYQGAPGTLTAALASRSYQLAVADRDRRLVLRAALELPSVCDGAIQGSQVRVVLRKDATRAGLDAFAGGLGTRAVAVQPRFEDAFIDLVGGNPGGHSDLASRMQPIAASSVQPVSCRNLSKRFGSFTATDSVTFSVGHGEIFGLLGPNGAGKSTTFKMLCGLLRPSAGEAHVLGLDLATAASAAKGRLGYMAQKFSLYGLLSVGQNLDFYAGVYGLSGALRKERVAEMIATFHLGDQLTRSPDELPLGFKQRLALACALMHRPAVLFLDEPTSGVDPVTRREFWTHIYGLVGKGVTILVTTHFMDEAEYCDRVALMYQARVIALDTPDALKRRAATPACPEPTMEDAFIALVQAADAPAEEGRPPNHAGAADQAAQAGRESRR